MFQSSMSNFQKYIEFVTKHKIVDFYALIAYVENIYHMKATNVVDDVYVVTVTHYSLREGHFLHHLTFQLESPITKPIYVANYSFEHVGSTVLTELPLDLSTHYLYEITTMNLFLIFYLEESWICVNMHYLQTSSYFLKELESNLEFDEMGKGCCYLFYCRHTNLSALFRSPVSTKVHLFQVYDRYLHTNCLDSDVQNRVSPCDKYEIENKFQLQELLSNVESVVCFLVVPKDNPDNLTVQKIYHCQSVSYDRLVCLANLADDCDPIIRYITMKQFTIKDRRMFLKCFQGESSRYRVLDEIFKKVIDIFMQEYMDVFVHQHNENILELQYPSTKSVLYKIHTWYLNTKKQPMKHDLEQLFLFVFFDKIQLANILDWFLHKCQQQ